MNKTACKSVRIGQRICRLTPLEYALFQCLKTHAGTVATREDLLRNIWGFPDAAETRSVDMCVRRLRSKIGPEWIRTVYGQGYMLSGLVTR